MAIWVSVQPPFPYFTDTDGSALEDGYIWLGEENMNPQTNPVAVYLDDAFTQPIAQPIRTRSGYPAINGAIVRLYTQVNYSIQVTNKNGSLIYSAPTPTEVYGAISENAADILYDPAGTGAVQTTVQAKLRESVSVKDFGAVGDGVTDDSPAIQNALNSSKSVIFNDNEEYLLETPVSLKDGQVLFLNGAKIIASASLSTAALTGTSVTGVRVYGGTIQGEGTAFATGDEHLMLFTSCSDVQIYGTVFTKSRNEGLRFVDCDHCVANGVVALNNYGTGFQDRDGVSNKWVAAHSEGNGDTGVAVYAGARGLLLWRCTDTQVIGGTFKGNSEYGFRVYSQTGDAIGSSAIKVISAHAEENGVIDFYVYNESGLIENVEFVGCTVLRTSDPSATCVALQGKHVSWTGGSATKKGARFSVPVFSLYGLSRSSIQGCSVENAQAFLSWSGTSVCDDILIANNIVECAVAGPLVGTKVTFRGNKFKHGGAGLTDLCIDAGATYSPIIDGNEFDGFYRNINWQSQNITLTNNTSRNTTDVSLRMNGDGVAGLASSGNSWDTGSNPTFVATAYRQANINSRFTAYGGAAPVTLTWARGDRIVQASPAVGQPKSWVCTVAGTPGTWVSEGVL